MAAPAFDEAWHYPAEVFSILVDLIPRINRSKRDVALFFRGAGVGRRLLAPWEERIRTDRESVRKVEIVRDVLERLNDLPGDGALRTRREIIKRLTEVEDFSTCWDSDRYAAEALVARLRDAVNRKDSFTRMAQEREREGSLRRERMEAEERERQTAKAKRERAQQELFGLFAVADPHERGRLFERALNALFEAHGISVRKSFTLRVSGAGVVEQVDGAIELDGHVYLVEAKWWLEPVGKSEVSDHLVRIYQRSEVRAIIISASDFTEPAIEVAKAALQQKIVVLCCLEELVRFVDGDNDIKDLLRRKIRHALIDKEPHVKILDPQTKG